MKLAVLYKGKKSDGGNYLQEYQHLNLQLRKQQQATENCIRQSLIIYKVHPCTGTEALYRLYGP